MEPGMKVAVDREKCCGAGQCVLLVPDVFDQDADNGVAFVLTGAPGPEYRGSVREAVAMCPTSAITAID
jgi:ferredoxin